MFETPEENLEKLQKLVSDIKFAMLTTIDEKNGELRSRPMATLDMGVDGNLWFFTAIDSSKVEEALRERRVNVSYANPDTHTYVSISGRADVVLDRERIQSLWRPHHKDFFPEGADDPELALLRVQILDAEYWASPANALGKAVKAMRSLFVKAQATFSKSEKLDLTSS